MKPKTKADKTTTRSKTTKKPASKSSQKMANKAVSMTTLAMVDWVRQRIKGGDFAPGQRLVEADIIRQTGAARNKIREAFQRLELEGLIIIEEFRGASVRRFSWDEVRQIYRTRMALEGLAAREFALADLPDAKQELQKLQDKLNQNVDAGDHDQFAILNGEWHDLIIENANNGYIRHFLSQLTVPIYRLLFSTFYSVNRIKSANDDHQIISAAIIDGRADDAEAAMRDHVERGLQSISKINAHFYG